ncbi:MAG TPA: hypothetical protein VHO90_01050, partial [Bacteroidales bacterium]|nr:hypothetical protein [Bacteroidales bacterium]
MKKTLTVTSIVVMLALCFTFVTNAQEQQTEQQKADEARKKMDWPNLNRFREENAKLGLPEKGVNRIVFMGNSITEGWSLTDPD